MKISNLENIRLGKFVHGGQAMAQLPDGKVIFVWGGLPDELVDVRVTKQKRSHQEGIVTLVHEPSIDRIEPEEPLSYLSTSPWQILSWEAENKAKQDILEETFDRVGLTSLRWDEFVTSAQVYGYRNKIEVGFWGDDAGLHYAHYIRGSHGKRITTSNALAMPAINSASADFLTSLRVYAQKHNVRAGDLKTVVFRSSQVGKVVVALFVKDRSMDFSDFEIPKSIQGVVIYYSNPKSPASIPTEKIYSYGDISLQDKIEKFNITYDVLSFFQVNIPVFSMAIQAIKRSFKTFPPNVENFRIVDMYSGVGTIGLAVGAHVLVDSDASNIKMAKLNVGTKLDLKEISEDTALDRPIGSAGLTGIFVKSSKEVEVVHAKSESALDQIAPNSIIIVDPPRAGLHKSVTQQLLEARPLAIVYLSCNPSTQARDVKLLSDNYKISYAQGYNFFPRTPHIESLVVLTLS